LREAPAGGDHGPPARRRQSGRFLARALGIGLGLATAAYCAVGGYLYLVQRSLLFRPDATRTAPAQTGLPQAEEVILKAAGQPDIVSWYIKPRNADAPVFLYLHGNAGNLSRRWDRFQFLSEGGAGVLAVSWRGYGGSDGSPSEEGFRIDARRALAYLAARGVQPENIVLFGESLGTGIAVMTAAELQAKKQPVRALILDSPYDSTVAIAAKRYWWLPVRLLMRDPLRADLAAPDVSVPTLTLQCRDDWATPFSHGQRLVSLLGGPVRSVIFERRCHVPPYVFGSGAAIRQFMADLGAGKPIR
jgi:uncharacterized protein